jgi:hypothetical protein
MEILHTRIVSTWKLENSFKETKEERKILKCLKPFQFKLYEIPRLAFSRDKCWYFNSILPEK